MTSFWVLPVKIPTLKYFAIALNAWWLFDCLFKKLHCTKKWIKDFFSKCDNVTFMNLKFMKNFVFLCSVFVKYVCLLHNIIRDTNNHLFSVATRRGGNSHCSYCLALDWKTRRVSVNHIRPFVQQRNCLSCVMKFVALVYFNVASRRYPNK